MDEFIWLLVDLFNGIFNKLNAATFRFGTGANDVTSVGSVLFAAIVIGFVVSLFWKGAKSQ